MSQKHTKKFQFVIFSTYSVFITMPLSLPTPVNQELAMVFKKRAKWAWWCRSVILPERQIHQEFKVITIYIKLNLRPAWVALCLKQTNKQIKLKTGILVQACNSRNQEPNVAAWPKENKDRCGGIPYNSSSARTENSRLA